MICKKCGKEIHDDAVFCNYCGEAVNAERETKESVEKNAEALTELSLEMRRLSDKMIASYVAYVKSTESAYKQLAAKYSAKSTELSKIIEKKERALENANNQISVLTYKIDEVNQDYLSVKEENNRLKMANDKLKSQADEISSKYEQQGKENLFIEHPVKPTFTTKICDNCGAELDADAVFCGKCGKRQGVIRYEK